MFPIDFCHIPVSIIKRSAGRSAVAAAAYRSGTKLTNEWDGMTHDYTRKGGIVHAEIMLPAYAPPEFADRSILWNSVEQIEKTRDSQLAREIEAALPRELSGEQQLALVRAYVKDNFVDKGMCADLMDNDHALEAADPLELAEIKRLWEPYINQLPDYAYLCKDLLNGKM